MASGEQPIPFDPSRRETWHPNRWDYSYLKDRLKWQVLFRNELDERELPNEIDFGTFAEETRKLTQLTFNDPKRNEHYRGIGIDKGTYALTFSRLRKADKPEGQASYGLRNVFEPQTITNLAGFLGLLHAHPFRVVFSPYDLTSLQGRSGETALIGVGAEKNSDGEGFVLFALRTNKTTFIFDHSEKTEKEAKQKADSAIEAFKQRYPIEFYQIDSYLSKPLWALTPNDVRLMNELYDKVIRYEAQRNGYAFYIAKLGATVAKRCNLAIPLLNQLKS